MTDRTHAATAIEHVRANYRAAIIPRCEERGCKLGLGSMPAHVTLKGESLRGDRRMCDCIVIAAHGTSLTITLVELKSKTAHAREVCEKLENGTRAALDLLHECGCSPSRLYHLALAKRWDASELAVVSKARLRVYGRTYGVLAKRCGASLHAVVR